MKKFIILLFVFVAIAGVVAAFVFSSGEGITGHAIKNIKEGDNKEKGPCFNLSDGRKICEIGKIKISSGVVEEVDMEIVDNKNNKIKIKQFK